ncbi:MAG: OmpA family protein [Bacteroidales bacterium]|nr:OmpA family protein [Bacteroidales bacterium]
MRKLLNIWLLLALFLFSGNLFAQEEGDDPCVQKMDKDSERLFKKARDFQKNGKKAEAFELYDEILEEHPEYLDVNYYYAFGLYSPLESNNYHAIKKDKSDVKKALAAFNRMYAVCPYYKPHCNLYAARIAYFNEMFSEAIKFASVIVENPDLFTKPSDSSKVAEAQLLIRKARFYDNILNHPVPFDPKPVAGISTQYDEYLGTISPDGTYFYFTRRKEVPVQGAFGSGDGETERREFFSYSTLKNGSFNTGAPLPDPFNHSKSEGSPTINITNDLLIFTRLMPTTSSKGHTYRNYDLYYSERIGDEWTEPKSLGSNINNPNTWESQASLSSDGRILFFASDRPGGFGGSDIWYSERNSDGSWRKPINLGPKINTEGNERSPFLHTDSKTLYFSSSGFDGIGGQDIFFSKLDAKGKWSDPVNIGYPINTENDEVDFFVSLDGKTGYFSSNHYGNNDWNIYEFELYEDARPHKMLIVKGSVTADDDELENAVVEIRDTAAKVIATGVVSSNNKQYAVATEVPKEDAAPLIVTVKKEGHSYDAQVITPEQITNEPIITKDAEIKAIETGKVCDLKDIYYETNSYQLTQASQVVVNLFVEFLLDNPTVKVEIQGHTDNIGNDNDNLLLSERRAKAVYDLVVSKGIPTSRLRYKGYGESQPIADNNTASGRAKNRRTVFLIYEQ